MSFDKVTQVYFSPNGNTEKVIKAASSRICNDITEYNLLKAPLTEDIKVSDDSVLIVAMPAYAGRIPELCIDMLHHLKGSRQPAIAMVVYGNRDYEDALIELKDILEAEDFCVIGAGAFIAQHSIFPQIAAGRPDENDLKLIAEFADNCSRLLTDFSPDCCEKIKVKGNTPYTKAGKVPLNPKGDNKCSGLCKCVRICPTHSISEKNPKKTNKETCISCGACIHICPRNARAFHGITYKIATKEFLKSCAEYKKPEMFYINKSS